MALRDWLASGGWDDVFLDSDRGLPRRHLGGGRPTMVDEEVVTRVGAEAAARIWDKPEARAAFGPMTRRTPMDRTIFLDGAFVPAADARVSVMDRGFLFADGIYEVSAVLDGDLVDNDAHLARLDRSLAAIGIANPHAPAEWTRLETELVRRNRLNEGVVYIQVTRGVAERDFGYGPDLVPTVVMFTQPKTIVNAPVQNRGVAVVTRPDLRWARRDIKSVGLLAQVMAKREAATAGASEVFMVEDGFITEGGSSTVFAIAKDGRILTRPLSSAVLSGITRLAVMRLAAERGLRLDERLISVDEACGAAEVFFTSASNFVVPVVSIDGRPIGDGRPGPRAARLMDLYVTAARAQARRSTTVRAGSDLGTPR